MPLRDLWMVTYFLNGEEDVIEVIGVDAQDAIEYARDEIGYEAEIVDVERES